VVVIDRFVARAAMKRTDPLVDGIFPERDRFIFAVSSEVAVHRFPNHRSDAHAAT
jgi:hypothetical protein